MYRKLIAVGTLQRNTNPKVSEIFSQDAKLVKKKFGLMKTPPKPKDNTKKSTSGSKTNRPKSKSSKTRKSKSSKTRKPKSDRSKK